MKAGLGGWAALLLMALTGCNSDPEVPKIVVDAPAIVPQKQLKDTIPKSEMVCAPEPDGSEVQTSRQVAGYIVDLRAAGQDCRRKLGVVRNLIRTERR